MQPEDETEITPPPESAITTKTYELPVGTTVSVRSEETIDSAKTIEGQTFAGQVTEDVRDASSRYQKVTDSGEPPTSCLALQKLAIDGREYEIRVIIGAIVGGGKGAAIGAGAGGGGGHWAKF